MNTLIRLVFSSDVTGSLDATTLQQIAASSERNNWRDGITGVLLTGPCRFVQVLEGERADVSACFARIASDARNAGCQLLSLTYIARRRFARWTMHPIAITPETEKGLDRLLDELEHGAVSAAQAQADERLTRLLKLVGLSVSDPLVAASDGTATA
jgi:hypothetical protein